MKEKQIMERELQEEAKGDNPFHEKEKAIEKKFDDYAVKVAQVLGQRVNNEMATVNSTSGIDWAQVLNGCLWTYFLLTVFSTFMRADFVSLTCIALAFMAISMPELQGRRTFRLVTAYLLVTFVYDTFWLLFLRDSDAEDAEEGGTGKFIRAIGVLCMLISFFFRIVVFAVMWKVSLNYVKTIKHAE